ncbi:hypothetical protein QE152_g31194 [Popillia japonica]|uniref:Uncharacterized protein n=1 Tax=Popillia japonica TaxID=7064 RepID=A0AAW1JC26_POPJA
MRIPRAYETAISAEDILKADEDAILDFWDDFSTSGNWHSLVGAAGLTLKHEVEKQVGVIYPDMSSRQRYKPLSFTNRKEEHEEHQRQQHQPSGSRDVSDIGQDETNSPMATDVVDAPQTENSIDNRNGVTNPDKHISAPDNCKDTSEVVNWEFSTTVKLCEDCVRAIYPLDVLDRINQHTLCYFTDILSIDDDELSGQEESVEIISDLSEYICSYLPDSVSLSRRRHQTAST